MRLKKLTDGDKYQIDTIFKIYEMFLVGAAKEAGKTIEDFKFHFERLEELKAKCKREE